jgi:hypothetical protein
MHPTTLWPTTWKLIVTFVRIMTTSAEEHSASSWQSNAASRANKVVCYKGHTCHVQLMWIKDEMISALKRTICVMVLAVLSVTLLQILLIIGGIEVGATSNNHSSCKCKT